MRVLANQFLSYSYYIKLEMSKMIVLLMDRQYPFTEEQISKFETQNILVRQTLSTPRFNKNTTLAKANFLKNLKNKYLVKVQELLEEEQTIHVMYQYVQNKLVNVLKGASTFLINKIYAQLHQFGRYLSNIGVRILFSIDRMGFTTKETLKYFMGVDFQWEEDPDQQYLEQFYQKQAEEILGPYFKQKIVPEITLSNTHDSNQKLQMTKLRKISYSTLPSRYNRFFKIDQKLKQIKSSSKVNDVQPFTRKPSSVETVPKNSIKIRREEKQYVKRQQRKYSGDIKCEIMSRNKLYQKESDIKSQYWPHKKKLQISSNNIEILHSEAGTSKTKSRTEEMKQKQYKQISNLKKDYLKDFISVLQQQDELALQAGLEEEKKKSLEIVLKKTESSQILIQNSTQQLQIMAKTAIQNSLKAINKFRYLIYDS